MTYIPGGGGTSSIATGSDVALNNPADAEVLTYDGALQKWKNAPVPTAISGNSVPDAHEVDVNSFEGVTPLAKMRTAMAAQAAKANPWDRLTIVVPHSTTWDFGTTEEPLQLYDGFRMRVGTGPANEFAWGNRLYCQGPGSVGAVFRLIQGTGSPLTRDCSWSNITFRQTGPNMALFEDNTAGSSGPILAYSQFQNVCVNTFTHVFWGRMLVVKWSGVCYVNNCTDTEFRLWGSDNTLWSDGILLDSPNLADTEYHIVLEHFEKSTVFHPFITGDGPTPMRMNGGLAVRVICGEFEGQNTDTAPRPMAGAAFWMAGGTCTLLDPWFFRAMNAPSNTGRGDNGVIHQTGGHLQLVAPTFAENGTAKTYNHIFVAGGTCDVIGQPKVWNYDASHTNTSEARKLKTETGGTGVISLGSSSIPRTAYYVAAAASNGGPFDTSGWDFICDGVNDEVDITNAISAAGSLPVILSAGTFNIDANVTRSNGVIVGQGDDTILQMGTSTTHGLYFTGTKTQIGGDGAFTTVAAGLRSVPMSADYTASLTVGDYIALTSGAKFAARSYYEVGEWNRVKSISATTLTVEWPLRHDYATGDILRLYKYGLRDNVRIENLAVRGNAASTVRGTGIRIDRSMQPVVRGVKIYDGEKLDNGIELQETFGAKVVDCKAYRVMDLNSTSGFTGYGVHTVGTYETVVEDLYGEGCRHTFDDSSLSRRPPSLRTKVVRGLAVDNHAAGWSTHGGSDECLFESPSAIDCGGGVILRGLAARGRAVVQGSISPASNEYTAIGTGNNNQSTRNALWIGEPPENSTYPNPGGTDIDFTIECDLRGAEATTSTYPVYGHSGCSLINSHIRVISHGHTHVGIEGRWKSIRNSKITGRITQPATNNQRIMQFLPPAGDGNNIKGLEITDMVVNGYGNRIVAIAGNDTNTAANYSDLIRIHGLQISGRQSGWAATSPLFELTGGHFSAVQGAVRVEYNTLRESSAVAKSDMVLSGTVENRGNVISSGYDIAP